MYLREVSICCSFMGEVKTILLGNTSSINVSAPLSNTVGRTINLRVSEVIPIFTELIKAASYWLIETSSNISNGRNILLLSGLTLTSPISFCSNGLVGNI